MKVIEITGEKLNQIMNALPKKERRELEKLLVSAASISPINIIKKWIKEFDDECPIDGLIARIVAQTISNVGCGINEEMEELAKKSDDPKYSGKDAARCAIEKIREIANQIESYIDHDTCGECCEQKH
ncbi:TPA: hypothetical protein ACPSKZ_000694 [Legionella anisa]|uniref:hypothetical protein n=1 Tax=Legionella anisa TaxID=28082 RepID=UPI002243F265|nr:hypothetical protein [Legionella anisa]MCW8425608.1 hypothetical protein [Legionella anisa]MCW8448963.1 hypothetical protein [Legionella anisa]